MAVAVPLAEMERLVGWRFPGGRTRIPRWESFLLNDVVCGPELPEGMVHPAACFHAPLAGIGMGYAEIFALCRAESDDAIRAGEYTFQIRRPLREEVEYWVEGEIVAVERKRGARIGLFDKVVFELRMLEPGGEVAVVAVNSWLFLRSEP
ncbi:MAG: hypothetical protein KatS3mg011_2267 [Acidimicrobiia bacterium]|nr:MAG: hypothetical protein KatS3mg011_2267 [Acidimicrobiia bacterium]